ncbi:MAG TPA: substrate-binding domain-containing protein [Phycisphaerales bacterium]|nr:substrate-binding domain-containing protein [Phycisphaerales bacterium]
MKTLKRLGAAALMGVLALGVSAGLGGCEKKPAANNTTPAPKNAGTNSGAGNTTATGDTSKTGNNAAAPAAGKKNLTIGVIAKSTGNPVFQAAKTGAENACRELGQKYGITIEMKWLTPVDEDAAKQAQNVEQLVSQGVDGISISCSNAETLTGVINDAVDKGVVVVTFDSDAPNSKRMAYYGINDVECGRAVMRELAKAMGDKGGTVAILSGNQTAPNLNARIQGVEEELAKLKDKGFTLKGKWNTKETPGDAAAMVQQVQGANPDIAGWAMVGGWPLFTQNALDNVNAKVVSVDTLREELDYVKAGKVQALIGQDCYGWGYESVRMIVEKLVEGKTPAKPINNFELAVVTPANVDQYYGKWEEWLGKK